MTTLLVSGGVLVDELSVRPMDVLIQNGRVQAIVPPGHGRAADSVIDASGLHVLPGVVDAHVHFNEPGRRLGLYPRKGALEIGSDADLVLVDLERTWTLEKNDLRTRWPGNPFVGKTFRGQVALTMVRGTVVWRDGAARVEPGFGRLVSA